MTNNTDPVQALIGQWRDAAEFFKGDAGSDTRETLMACASELEAALAQQPAARGVGDGCHCATCKCNPGMTPAIRFDTSPAAQEGAIRDHLIALGWTPPGGADTMTTNTDGHTCSYYCERPECVRRQRDELRDRMEAALAAQQQGGVDEFAHRVMRIAATIRLSDWLNAGGTVADHDRLAALARVQGGRADGFAAQQQGGVV